MKKAYKKYEICPNCGHSLQATDNFCPQCGQRNKDIIEPVWRVIVDFLENTLNLDAKVIRTIFALLLKPGLLTKEYNIGRRVSYVPPVRLYIIMSFVFFLVFALFNNTTDKKAGSIAQPTYFPQGLNTGNAFKTNEKESNSLNLTVNNIKASELKGLTEAQTDSLINVRLPKESTFERYMVKQLHIIANQGYKVFIQKFMQYVSYMMFVLMPFFGLILFAFYYKSAGYYIKCLIASIHFHSFMFLILSIYLLITEFVQIPYSEWFILLFPFYLFLSIKRIFEKRIFITLVKTTLISVMYFISLLFFVLITLMISIMLY